MPSLNGNRGFSYSSRSTDKDSAYIFSTFSQEGLNNGFNLLRAAINVAVVSW